MAQKQVETETHTVQTQFGEAEVETYVCDSCENRVNYDNTYEFTCGDREGRACEVCVEKGPVSFPGRVLEFSLPYEEYDGDKFGVGFHIFTGWLLIPFGVPETLLASDPDEFKEGFAMGVITMFVWYTLVLLCAAAFLHFF